MGARWIRHISSGYPRSMFWASIGKKTTTKKHNFSLLLFFYYVINDLKMHDNMAIPFFT